MEVRKVADTVLRCQSASLANLLAPASTTPAVPWRACRQLASRNAYSLSRRRTFITTIPNCAFKPSATTVASPPPSRNEDKASQEDELASIDKAARDLSWIQGGGSRTTSYQRGQEKSTLPRQREIFMNRGSSADDILKTMNSTFPSSSAPSADGIDLSRMQNPSSTTSSESARDVMSAITTLLPKQEKIPIRLSPSTGRSVAIQGHVDVARGFKLMERTVAFNGIRRQATQQRYHERRALKKKRLQRQRWRVKFMAGFKATVAKVKKLKKQGW